LFPYFADTPNAFHVLAADYVSTEDGTGVVHMAPGFGEEDQNVCNAVGIPTICPMDEHGRYTAEITPWAHVHVFDANPMVVKELKSRGVVVRHDSYNHSYPHCWRCAEPLVYRAISSWFVQVTAFRDRMVELNQQIRWVPEHIKEGSFGKWLANARDWSISRNRFWGSPIPVWRSDNPEYPRIDVYGSIEQLQADFGVEVTDLHRPYVDELVRPNPDDPSGQSMMRRVPEVLDCWFESGSMPFAQVHYPFENAEWFESHYPGDFIVEYIGQTRGWFYTLHVLATALFDRPSFTTCVSHGIVLGDDGQKMSKTLKNYPDPMMVFDNYGSDAMRWYLLSSPILRGTDLVVTEDGIRDTVRQVILPIWNSWYFLSLYANAAGTQGTFRTDSTDVLDRYILAKTHDLLGTLTTHDGRLRPVRRVRQRCGRSSTRSPTGTCAAAATASGRATRPPSTPCTPCCRCCAGRWHRCCRSPPRPCTGAHRRAQRAPHRLARGLASVARRRGPRAVDGPRPRRVQQRAARAQGAPAPRAPAARLAAGGGARCRPARRVQRPHRRRGEREVGAAHRRRRLGRDLRPAGRAGGARAAPGQPGAAGDQGREDRRLAAHRRRRGGRWRRAAGRGVRS
jgi:hypothetical protein